MEEKDFYKFAANLKEYVNSPLQFVDGIDATPTAYCKDILIHFNHYHTKEEADTKWNERCQRINYDNLYFICSDRWSQYKELQPTEDDIRSLSTVPAQGRCVFAVHEYEGLDYIYHLRKDPDDDCVYPYMVDKYKFLPFWKWQFEFDYVKWLNNKVENDVC